MALYAGVKAGPVAVGGKVPDGTGRGIAKVFGLALVLALGWQVLLLLPAILLGLLVAYWIVWRPVVRWRRRRGEDPWTASDMWRNR